MVEVSIYILVFIVGYLISYVIYQQKITALKLKNNELAVRLDESKKIDLTDDKEEIYQHNQKLLNPLKENIEYFKNRIETLNKEQSNERVELKKQIELLEKTNKEMLLEAENLTNALNYDNKTQGDFGEMQLELILQGSGLKEGVEYHKQQAKRDEDGNLYKPDFIIKLPNEKDIVIDSKVSLKKYNEYVNGDKSALKEHIKSIQNHINSISLKSYENLEGVNTLDFIFVFFPIEASLLVALEQDPNLFNNAIKKNVALVSPSTLIMSLKVVSHIWDIEKQNKNTEEIVRLAGSMCDKFYGFIDSVDEINKSLEKAQQNYKKAKDRLSEGRGNAIITAEKIKDLGVRTKKQLT